MLGETNYMLVKFADKHLKMQKQEAYYYICNMVLI